MHTKAEIQSFLSDNGWEQAKAHYLAADFSSRRFLRLTRETGAPATCILMASQKDQKTEEFVQIAALLRRLGLASPEIYASDVVRGLVLMEDFGDAPVGKMLDAGAVRDVYDTYAVDVLAKLHQGFQQAMLGALKSPFYNAALLTDQATLFLDYYFPSVFHRPATARERSGFVEAWHGVLSPLDALPRSLVLRDFMPDNTMELPSPILGQPVGLLDFQDAGIGCIAYDLASWCEEVRREDGLSRLEAVVTAYHAKNPAVPLPDLLAAARVYAAQRHTRILGLLVKLERDAMIPRVWKTLQLLLKEEALAPVRRWFLACRPS
ncbi:MAG: phosphotransferase [Alphaproteobacteria bacterium]|nr:phosphotransferase [Alphaproteobacteria bacterium]